MCGSRKRFSAVHHLLLEKFSVSYGHYNLPAMIRILSILAVLAASGEIISWCVHLPDCEWA